eukprot:6515201-Alexandrium_andersonii.AAC.1
MLAHVPCDARMCLGPRAPGEAHALATWKASLLTRALLAYVLVDAQILAYGLVRSSLMCSRPGLMRS